MGELLRVQDDWQEKLESEHELLFSLVQELRRLESGHSCEDDSLTGVMARLLKYAGEHFRNEEAVMIASGYARIGEHQAAHEEIIQRLSHLTFEFERDGGNPAQPLAELINYWLAVHVETHDRFLDDFLASRHLTVMQPLSRLRAA